MEDYESSLENDETSEHSAGVLKALTYLLKSFYASLNKSCSENCNIPKDF